VFTSKNIKAVKVTLCLLCCCFVFVCRGLCYCKTINL